MATALRRSLAKGQPLLPAAGRFTETRIARAYAKGGRPSFACTWCGRKTVLSLGAERGCVCPDCDWA